MKFKRLEATIDFRVDLMGLQSLMRILAWGL